MPTTVDQRARRLEPGVLVTLYELDLTAKGGTILYFHDGKGGAEIGFLGHIYTPYPIRAEGFEWSTQGTLPRPKLSVSNIGSAVSALCRTYDDLVGCTIIQRRTFSDYILGGIEDSNPQQFTPQIFVVDRKVSETNTVCSFELATGMDAEGIMLPRRQILATACPFTYRGVECGYAALAIGNRLGLPFGPSFTNGVTAGDILTSATASFQTTDVGKTITGPVFQIGTKVIARQTVTKVQLNIAALEDSSGNTFTINRLVDRGLYSTATTYAKYDMPYMLVNGIVVRAVSLFPSNTNHPFTDENWWFIDVCLKKLSDCWWHFGATAPVPFGGFPGAAKLQ